MKRLRPLSQGGSKLIAGNPRPAGEFGDGIHGPGHPRCYAGLQSDSLHNFNSASQSDPSSIRYIGRRFSEPYPLTQSAAHGVIKFVMNKNMEAIGGKITTISPIASDLFDQAEAYWLSAVALESAKVKSDLSSQPIRALYYRAVELYLKAYLRIHGHSLDELEGKFQRDFRRIRKRCESLGLEFADRDAATIEYFVRTPLSIRAKYSTTSYYSAPAPEALNGLCRTLRRCVATKLGSPL